MFFLYLKKKWTCSLFSSCFFFGHQRLILVIDPISMQIFMSKFAKLSCENVFSCDV